MKNYFVLGLLAGLCLTREAGALPAFPLRLSADKRTFEDQNGKPFLINGDTPWSLMVQPTTAQATLYLDDRAQKGFTALIVNLIEHQFSSNPPKNAAGVGPFTTPGDFSTPSEAYFAHADTLVKMAAARGILLVLAPSYLGYGCGSEGWCQEMLQNGAVKLRNYGRYVGNRYKNDPNILWLEACDADAGAYGAMDEVDAVAYGIQEADTVAPKFHTAHCYRQHSALDCYDRPWLSVNTTYSDCASALSKSLNDYSRYASRNMPFFFVEGTYENEGASEACLRGQAYTSILSGSTGHFFGNCPLWHFGYSSAWCSLNNWQAQLNGAGSVSISRVGALFNSREWQKLVPDVAHTVITAGTSGLAAARASDGNTVIAYLPTERQVTVDMAKIAGANAKAHWYNPATGAATLIGTYPATGTRNFTPGAAGDWVLVVDNAALPYPAPGQGPVTANEARVQTPALEIFVSPNPVTGGGRVTITPPVGATRGSPLHGAVWDSRGRRVAQFLGSASPWIWETKGCAPGIYMARVTAGETRISRKLTLIR